MIRHNKPESVYIVDDQPTDYVDLLDGVDAVETRVVFFRTGREALRNNPEDTPMMWVINTQLPDMSGTDLQAMLRARGCQSPIALVGDEYRPEDEINARISGAAMYFAKPMHTETLLASC